MDSEQRGPVVGGPTGPRPGWPASPPVAAPQPVVAATHVVAGPPPTTGWPGVPHYHPTPPRDPRWTSGRMFGVTCGVAVLTGGPLGMVTGVLVALRVLSGATGAFSAEVFDPLAEAAVVAGAAAVLIGVVAGGSIGLFLGLVGGVVGGAVAAATFQDRSPRATALSAGAAGAVLVGLLVAMGLRSADAWSLVLGSVLMSGGSLFVIVALAARRAADAATRAEAAPAGPFG